MNKCLQAILENDRRKYISTLGFFSNYKAEEIITEGSSAMVIGKSDNLWAHIISDSESELKALLEKVQGRIKFYYSVDDWMIPLILKNGIQDWIMSTNRFVLEEKVNIPEPSVESSKINQDYAQYLLDNSDYKDFLSKEYIIDRLEKDVSAGIHLDNKLVAWGFTHDDGALGFLHVLEEYRKKGLGREIMLGLIKMKRKEKKDVFGNILPDNVASSSLVSGLGFYLDRRASWIKLN